MSPFSAFELMLFTIKQFCCESIMPGMNKREIVRTAIDGSRPSAKRTQKKREELIAMILRLFIHAIRVVKGMFQEFGCLILGIMLGSPNRFFVHVHDRSRNAKFRKIILRKRQKVCYSKPKRPFLLLAVHSQHGQARIHRHVRKQ